MNTGHEHTRYRFQTDGQDGPIKVMFGLSTGLNAQGPKKMNDHRIDMAMYISERCA